MPHFWVMYNCLATRTHVQWIQLHSSLPSNTIAMIAYCTKGGWQKVLSVSLMRKSRACSKESWADSAKVSVVEAQCWVGFGKGIYSSCASWRVRRSSAPIWRYRNATVIGMCCTPIANVDGGFIVGKSMGLGVEIDRIEKGVRRRRFCEAAIEGGRHSSGIRESQWVVMGIAAGMAGGYGARIVEGGVDMMGLWEKVDWGCGCGETRRDVKHALSKDPMLASNRWIIIEVIVASKESRKWRELSYILPVFIPVRISTVERSLVHGSIQRDRKISIAALYW